MRPSTPRRALVSALVVLLAVSSFAGVAAPTTLNRRPDRHNRGA